MKALKSSLTKTTWTPRNEPLLRLAVVDYPKLQSQNTEAFNLLGDMLRCRQSNFLETDASFLVIDKHDLIGTHFLVYDTTRFLTPKIVAGFRITYEDRANEHKLKLPIEGLLSLCPPEARTAFDHFRVEKGPTVQFNTLFIDPEYTYSHSNLRLSDMLFFSVCAYIRRLGFNHFVGATNDELKTDRWMKRAANYKEQTFSFMHPDVNASHTLFFVDSIREDWLRECFTAYAPYWQNCLEILPDGLKLKSWADLLAELEANPTLSPAA